MQHRAGAGDPAINRSSCHCQRRSWSKQRFCPVQDMRSLLVRERLFAHRVHYRMLCPELKLVHDMAKIADRSLPPGTTGLVLHEAAFYDFTVWLMTGGRERAFRESILRLAHLELGETVLDVGCGTGSLAIAAKRHVGPAGTVNGIDASSEMVARAEKKARRAGSKVVFKQAAAQGLPFPDAQFDAVFSAIMLHHLPRKARKQCAQEMRRILKPGGRVLAVDFAAPAQEERGFLHHFHRHGHVKLEEIIASLEGAGLNIIESGAVGRRNLHFALATNSG